jgi:uncharacterized protein (TIGR02118 family)
MHKMLVLYPHPQDEKKFRPYYERTHIPMAKKLPGLIDCRYSFSIEGVRAPSPYYCVFEAEFASAAAMGSPQGQAVPADVPNFATTMPVVVHYEVEG